MTMQTALIDQKGMEHLSLSVKAIDDVQGIITGHLSVFNNIDLGQDKVVRGAFKDTLAAASQRRAKSGAPFLWPLLWQHNSENLPIGGITSAIEDAKGLAITARLDLAQGLARDAYSAVKFGSIGAMSMGYRTVDSSYEVDAATGKNVRLLKSVELVEGSLVLWPMNTEATISTVKAADEEAKEGRVLSSATLNVLKKAVDGITNHVNDMMQHMAAMRANSLQGYPLYGSSSSNETYDIASALQELTAMLEDKAGAAISQANHQVIAQATTNIMKHVRIIKGLVDEHQRLRDLTGIPRIASSQSSFDTKAEDDPLVVELRELNDSLDIDAPSSRSALQRLDELDARIGLDLALAALLASES
jgi:HK97 family phage prohead protease